MAKGNKRSSGTSATATSATSATVPRLLCIRWTLVLLVTVVTGLSLYFSYSLTTLYSKVQSDSLVIDALRSQVDAQSSVINRFNNSVTNADVEDHVNALEHNLKQTEADMKQQLDATTASINALLTNTVNQLDATVKAAQAEINSEVNIVKADVDQYVRTTQDQFSMENSFMKFQLAGTFCLLAILISMWHMTAHVRQFKRPFVQRKILAILWMSPIYAITSWLSLVFPQFEGYLSIIKDFYEAYVIYQFLSMCMSVIGCGDRDTVVNALAEHAHHLDPPLRLCGCCRKSNPYPTAKALASAVLMQCQVFAMQFVFLKPLTAIGLFTCQKYSNICTIDPNHVHDYQIFGVLPLYTLENPLLWLRIIQNISVFMAFSGLLKFYHAVQDDLAWCNPFPKFLCIKGIVFMTFWQGLVISFLATTTNDGGAGGTGGAGGSNTGATAPTDGGTGGADDPELWGKQAQNFLICLEMLLFSIAHFYCFPTDEWQEGYRPKNKEVRGLDNMAFGDFVADLKLIMRGTKETKKKQKKSTSDLGDENDVHLVKDNNIVAKLGDGDEVILIDQTIADVEEGLLLNNNKNKLKEEENEEMNDNYNDSNEEDDNDKEEKNNTKEPSEEQNELYNDDDDDDDDVLDDTLDEETMDRLLSQSIRESLNNTNSDIREAAHRLLCNRMVEIERMSEGSRSSSTSTLNKKPSDSITHDSTYGAVTTSNRNVAEFEAMSPMGGGGIQTSSENSDNAEETTSLLGNNTLSANNNFG